MGATYALTTDHFDAGQFAVVTLAGAGAGALIGSGVGIAAGMTAMSTATAMAVGGTLVGAGVGAASGGESQMISQWVSSKVAGGQTGGFDTVDFLAAYTAGGVSGAINGSPLGKTPLARIASDTAGGALESAISDIGHGRAVDGTKLVGSAVIGASNSILYEGLESVSPIGARTSSQRFPDGSTVEWQWTPGMLSDPRVSLDPKVVASYILGTQSRQAITSFNRSMLIGIGIDVYDLWLAE